MIVHDVEQGTEAWHNLRAGIPTASEFSQLVTSSGTISSSISEYAILLATEKYRGKAAGLFGGNAATRRGKALEPEARADYEMVNMVRVDEVGFITDNLMRYGCSPDGLIGKDGGVEFKCKTDKEHAKALFYYMDTGQTPPEYVAQPQGCMFVTGRKWWDLRFYHPDLPCLTIRQYPDQLFFKNLRKSLKSIETERNLYIEKLRQLEAA